MHYASGVINNGIRIIERMITFPFKQQSSVYVEGDHYATRDALIRMANFGYFLHAVCHSHPGKTIHSTLPSNIDLEHQSRLEKGGYQAISCIFSRDGFVRFFSVNLVFELNIYGEGVEKHGKNVFRLTEID
jgi:hypothetical protein